MSATPPGRDYSRIPDPGYQSGGGGCLPILGKVVLWGFVAWVGVVALVSVLMALSNVSGDAVAVLVIILLVVGGAVGWYRTTVEASSNAAPKDGEIIEVDPPKMEAYSRIIGSLVTQGGSAPYVAYNHVSDQPLPARARSHVLVLGPSQSGKTSSVIVPAVATYSAGPVVVTSSKVDVIEATYKARRLHGRLWLWDPSGQIEPPPGVERLRWSPLQGCATWGDAQDMAHAMVTASPQGRASMAGDGQRASEIHFTTQAQALLAALLYAAARPGSGADIGTVVRWVNGHELKDAKQILRAAYSAGDPDAMDAHDWIQAHERMGIEGGREQASVVSTLQNFVRSCYSTASVVATGQDPNFEPEHFVAFTPKDTIYAVVPPRSRDRLAPLVVGLLTTIRHAAEATARRAERQRGESPPVLFALDEVANIAPIHDLDQLVSEGMGQGIRLMAAFQDMAQARHRWGDQTGQSFLSLFQDRVVFPGIVDQETLRSISETIGEAPRMRQSWNQSRQGGWPPSNSQGTNTEWTYERVLRPEDIAGFSHGYVLVWRPEGYRFFQAPKWRPDRQEQPWYDVVRSLEEAELGPVTS